MFDQIIDIAKKAGETSLARERGCEQAGGHFKDSKSIVNSCGFAAPKQAIIWGSR